MKNWLRDKIIFPCLEMLPCELMDKLKMLGTCCFGSGWGYYFLSGFANEFENVSEEEVISLYSGVSERSLRVLRDYLKFNCLSVYFCKYMDVKENDNIIIPVDKIFPGLKDKLRLEKKLCRQLVRKSCFKYFAPEVCCYHHGLTFTNSEVHSYIKDKVFIDCGAFNGDSAFFLSKYDPQLILSFEPSAANCALYRENMKNSGIENIELIQAGISDEAGFMLLEEGGEISKLNPREGYKVDVVALDDFMQKNPHGKIGLIKADLEGMGLKMVKGAIETIKRDRPVLLLSIYHNRDEFLGIYQYLKENVSDYHYKVESLAGLREVSLIAFPCEVGKD